MSVAEMTLRNKVLIPFVFVLLRRWCFFLGRTDRKKLAFDDDSYLEKVD